MMSDSREEAATAKAVTANDDEDDEAYFVLDADSDEEL